PETCKNFSGDLTNSLPPQPNVRSTITVTNHRPQKEPTMNTNTTTQRKTTKTAADADGRPRGAIAHRLARIKHVEDTREHLRVSSRKHSPDHIEAILESHNADHVLVAVSDNKAAVLNSEGVGTKETDGTVGVFIETGLQVDRVDIPVDRIVAAM